jgi:effector-binding domain-containing protein
MPGAVYFTPPGADMSQAKWQVRAPLAGDPSACPADESGCGIEHIEPMKVAFAMHKGPYETISETYNLVAAWIAANGMTMAGPPEESYFSDPATTAPEDYLTEIRMPVV